MADQPVFESPIRLAAGSDDGPDAALLLSDESAVAKLLVRADEETAAAQQLAVGFGSSRQADGVLICGQRPTEWLLLGTAETVQSFVAGLDRSGHVSIVDHTHSRALIRLTGEQAPQLLEKICSLDWDDLMMPDSAVVSASVAKVNCDIVRHDLAGIRSYRLACDRSFAQYLFDVMLDAGREFGVVGSALG